MQECFDEFEFQFGKAVLPISFSAFKVGFTNITTDKVVEYHNAVRLCKQQIAALQQQGTDQISFQIAARQRLKHLNEETLR